MYAQESAVWMAKLAAEFGQFTNSSLIYRLLNGNIGRIRPVFQLLSYLLVNWPNSANFAIQTADSIRELLVNLPNSANFAIQTADSCGVCIVQFDKQFFVKKSL